MAESELEEGEAGYYNHHLDVDEKTVFDPDKDLAYIDEKLQSLLGHFQKNFEGGVNVENLGAAYGGYGSFLPMHQRCPLVKSDQNTPQISQNYDRSRSPDNLHLEGMSKNPLVPSKAPPSLKDGNTSPALHLHDQKPASLDGSTKLDPKFSRAQASVTLPPRFKSSSEKPGDQTEKKRITLRIKVRSDCSAPKKAAIYSEPRPTLASSPVGYSPKDSGRDPSELNAIPVESPSSILQYMTSFSDTVAMLLSPLHPSLLNLTAKKNIHANSKLSLPIKVHPNDSTVSVNNPASTVVKDRKRKLSGGIGTVEEANGVNYVINPTSPARKCSKFETTEEQQYISSDLKTKSLSSPACNSGESSNSVFRVKLAKREAVKDVPPKKRIIKKDWVKDRIGEESVKLMHGRDGAKYDQQEPRSDLMERIRGQGTKSSEKHISDDLGGGRAKGVKVYSLSKDQLDVSKRKKDTSSNVNNHPKQKVRPSFTPNKQYMLGQIEGFKKLPLDDKTKSKGRLSDIQFNSHLTDERLRSDNILKSKERPQKNVAKLPAGNEDMHDWRLQHSTNKLDPLGRSSLDCMTKDQNIETGKEKYATDDVAQPDGEASESVDEWVQCDSCDKWRLLPYGIKAEHMPDNWLCSMLDWLRPGMNRCDIAEGETTSAVLALRQPALLLPVSNKFQSHDDQIATGVSSADVPSSNQDLGMHDMRNRGKKKHTAKEIPAAVTSSGVLQTSSLTKNSRENMKNRFLNDMNKPLPKANLISESTKCPDNLSDSPLGRSACKQMDEGATKLKRLKLKREPDQSGCRTSKRVMTESAVFKDEHRSPISCGNPARMDLGLSAGLPSSTTWNNTHRHSEHLYSKDGNCELKDRVPISVKTLKSTSLGISNSGSMGMKKNNESHGMKRKLKDRQDSQCNLEAFCREGNNLPDDERVKEMKPRVSMLEGQESSACRGDDKKKRKGKVTRIILSGSRDTLTTIRIDQQQKYTKSYKPKLTSDDIAKLRKDLGCEQFSAAATSSSSKVSGSHKRSSYQKARESPVESVSSSPLRSSNLTKVSLARRGSVRNDYANTCQYSAGGAIQSLEHGNKLDRNQIGVGSRGEVSGVFQAQSMSFPKLECQDHDVSGEADSNVKHLNDLKSKHLLTNNEDALTQHKQCSTDVHSSDDCQSAERRNTILDVNNGTFPRIPGNDSTLLSEDIDKSSYDAKKVNMKPSDLLSDREFKPNNDKYNANRCSDYSQGDTKVKMLEHKCSNEKSVDLCSLDERSIHEDKCWGEFAKPSKLNRAAPRYEKTNAYPHNAGKQEPHTHVRQPVSPKGSGLDTRSSIGRHDVSKVLQKSKNCVHLNGAHQVEGNHLDQSVYQDIGISKPVKGYNGGQAASDVLREAEDLKGHAEHLKKSGFSFDSIMANFQAALKSLLGASLLESESSRCGRSDCAEISQAQIYSSTAKLFETCAQDFGKHDEMYAAALAYKCTEVAYMGLVYCKSYMADKDRSDLLANLQMLPQGESPSSSASDVDNLYNQITMDKTALLRGKASNAANHVTLVQNRPTIIRMLQFTHDMSLAMEASKKSHVAFEAANEIEILKKAERGAGASAVKKVLDSSFQDIQEFTRLVRLANEVICSSHI